MMNEGADKWIELIKMERKKFDFETDMETFGKIKQFKAEHSLTDLNQAIDCLLNLGLCTMGYKDEQDIKDQFNLTNFSTNITPPNEISSGENVRYQNEKTIDKNESDNAESTENIDGLEDIMMEKTLAIIKQICMYSNEGNALHYDIITEAASNGLESRKVEEAIQLLKKQRKIIESEHNRYKIPSARSEENYFEF